MKKASKCIFALQRVARLAHWACLEKRTLLHDDRAKLTFQYQKLQTLHCKMGSCGTVHWLDSRSEGLWFDFHPRSYVEVSGKLLIP